MINRRKRLDKPSLLLLLAEGRAILELGVKFHLTAKTEDLFDAKPLKGENNGWEKTPPVKLIVRIVEMISAPTSSSSPSRVPRPILEH